MPYLQTGDLPYQHDQDEPGAGTSREGARNVAPLYGLQNLSILPEILNTMIFH